MKNRTDVAFKGKFINWMEIVLSILFVFQFLAVLYFNICLMKNHMGYDSSWTYLKASLIWNEKSINSSNWIDQTNVFLDSSMILATFIYALTKNVLLSYGIANMVIVVLILMVMWKILSLLDLSKTSKLVSVNMIICPYLTNGLAIENDLGYFNSVLSGPAFYSLRVLLSLLIVYEFLIIKKKDRNSKLLWVTLLLCVLAGLSSGVFIIAVILLPYLVYEVEVALIENDLKILKRREAIFAFAGCASVIAGKLIAHFLLGIWALDATRAWTPVEKIWTNAGAVFQGFMMLMGVLPVTDTGISVMSAEGVIRFFPIIIFLVAVVAFGYAVAGLKDKLLCMQGVLLFLVNVVVVNILMYSLFNVTYGSPIFEERYLVTTFMIVTILVAVYINALDNKSLYSYMVLISLFLALLGNDLVSDKKFVETTNDHWEMDRITDVVDSEDAELIYVWGSELVTVGRALRVYDQNHVYKVISSEGGFVHWGDYLYYEDNADYSGKTLLIIPKGSTNVPANILDQYKLVSELSWVEIYESDRNPIDMVTGPTGDMSIDYPSSFGVRMQGGDFDGNSYISNGTEELLMSGPDCGTSEGTYDITLFYRVMSGGNEDKKPSLEITLDGGATTLDRKMLDFDKSEVTIQDLQLENGHTMEYKVICPKETILRLDKIEIKRK